MQENKPEKLWKKWFRSPLIPVSLLYYILLWNPDVLGVFVTPVIVLAGMCWLGFQVLHTPLLNNQSKQHSFRIWLIITMWNGILIWYARFLFLQHPVNINTSDILPLIRDVYYSRWINGIFVYNSVEGYGYGTWVPNYLPMHWMPFIPAFYYGFEPRYLPVLLFLGVQLIYQYRLNQIEMKPAERYLKVSLPYLLLCTIMYLQPKAFAHSIEFLIAGYYVWLMLSLVFNQRTGMMLGLWSTLLSRYAVLFFIPIHWILEIYNRNFKKLIVLYAGVFILVSLTYFIPFLSKQPDIFFNGAGAYDAAAAGEWKGQAWQTPGSLPHQLFQGYGFASWFYNSTQTQHPEPEIRILKYALIGIMGIHLLVWLLLAKRCKTHPLFLALALFCTLTVFFSFVLVPYNYLFWNVLFMLPVLVMRIPLFAKN